MPISPPGNPSKLQITTQGHRGNLLFCHSLLFRLKKKNELRAFSGFFHRKKFPKVCKEDCGKPKLRHLAEETQVVIYLTRVINYTRDFNWIDFLRIWNFLMHLCLVFFLFLPMELKKAAKNDNKSTQVLFLGNVKESSESLTDNVPLGSQREKKLRAQKAAC